MAFEDRLRKAGVAYRVTRAPVWSNNQYAMELLIGATTPAAAGGGWHPSVLRVQQEIERMQHPMVSVRKVTEAEADYIADLDVLDGVPVDAILQRLRANSTLFGDIALIEDTSDATRQPAPRAAALCAWSRADGLGRSTAAQRHAVTTVESAPALAADVAGTGRTASAPRGTAATSAGRPPDCPQRVSGANRVKKPATPFAAGADAVSARQRVDCRQGRGRDQLRKLTPKHGAVVGQRDAQRCRRPPQPA